MVNYLEQRMSQRMTSSQAAEGCGGVVEVYFAADHAMGPVGIDREAMPQEVHGAVLRSAAQVDDATVQGGRDACPYRPHVDDRRSRLWER